MHNQIDEKTAGSNDPGSNDISQMGARCKSVLLALAMGWKVDVWPTGDYGKRGEQYKAAWVKADGTYLEIDVVGYSEEEAAENQVTNFYAPKDFAEGWGVLNWAANHAIVKEGDFPPFHVMAKMEQAAAQEYILDLILSRCVFYGLVKP